MFRYGNQLWKAVAVVVISSSGWALSASAQTTAMPGGTAQSASTATAQGSISGTVAYRERMALPPDAAVDVKLQDVSAADAPAKTIGETVFAPAGKQVPLPFQITYDPGDINPAHTYQVRANITVDGKLMFTSNTAYPVITHGSPSQVAIMLQQAQFAAPATTTMEPSIKLRQTHWILAEVNGTAAAPGEGHPAHLDLHKKGKLSGSTGCNNLAGTYIAEQGSLQFTPAATTMKMCPQALMQQEQSFLEALKATSGYKIDGSQLELTNGDKVLAKFQSEPK